MAPPISSSPPLGLPVRAQRDCGDDCKKSVVVPPAVEQPYAMRMPVRIAQIHGNVLTLAQPLRTNVRLGSIGSAVWFDDVMVREEK